MGTVIIEEYANLADVRGRDAQIPGTVLNTQVVTSGSSSVRTTVDFDESTNFLIISSNADEAFALGDGTVSASATDRPLYASTYREVQVKPGTQTRIAFINK